MYEVRDVPWVVRRKSRGMLANKPRSRRTALNPLSAASTHLDCGLGRASGSGVALGGRSGSSHLRHDPARYKCPREEGEVVMFTNANTATVSVAPSGFARRSLLGMVVIAAAPLSWRALAETAPADATTTIKRFNGALLAAMKSGGRTDFSRRFQTLAPEVDQAFDLSAVLSVSVGPSWASLSPDQQSRLLDAFRRYTVASYVANFDSYAGQHFTVSPDTRSLGVNRVVVQSRIVKISGDPTELDYVMKRTPLGWKVVDVLAGGSISRVAVQRSDFRRILSHGGDALLASLQRKTSDLSGGRLVYRMIGNSLR
jgi:phospholipid transport system substrate-binding protein